jgi:hypothetical protein
VTILEELLTFVGDSTISNKAYYFTPDRMTRPKGIKTFTIQVEALFSFTRMLTQGLPKITPVLIDTRTDEYINGNHEAIKKVYTIYNNWLKENKLNNFKNRDFPLEGTNYEWQGDQASLKKHRQIDFGDK